MSNKEVGRFFRHSSIYAVGNVLNRVGAFLLLPIYTRLLTTGEYGALETFYLISTVISGILAVGIGHATLRFYFDYKEAADRHAVVSTNLIASLVICSVGIALVWPLSGTVESLLFKGQDFGHAYEWMLATIIFELSSQVSLSYVRATERSVLFIVISLVKLIVQVIANSVALLYLNAGVEGVMAGNFLTVVLGWLALTAFTVRHCGLRFQLDKLLPVLRYSFPFLLTTLITLVSATADRFMLQTLVSLEALGIFALAVKFAKLISDLVGEPVNRAYGAFRYTIMEREDAPQIQARLTRYLAILLVLAGIFVVLFTGNVLDVMADRSYRASANYVPWLVLAAVLQTLVYPLQTGIYYQKESSQLFWVALAQCAAGVGLGALLIWPLGILGACLTAVVVAIVTFTMTNRISQRYFKVDYDWGKLASLLALALAITLAGLAADRLTLWWSVAVKLLVLVPGFLAGVVVLRILTPQELAEIGVFVRGRLKRSPGAPA